MIVCTAPRSREGTGSSWRTRECRDVARATNVHSRPVTSMAMARSAAAAAAALPRRPQPPVWTSRVQPATRWNRANSGFRESHEHGANRRLRPPHSGPSPFSGYEQGEVEDDVDADVGEGLGGATNVDSTDNRQWRRPGVRRPQPPPFPGGRSLRFGRIACNRPRVGFERTPFPREPRARCESEAAASWTGRWLRPPHSGPSPLAGCDEAPSGA
jgi:hypothetical protein